jgi:hypothetical protein
MLTRNQVKRQTRNRVLTTICVEFPAKPLLMVDFWIKMPPRHIQDVVRALGLRQRLDADQRFTCLKATLYAPCRNITSIGGPDTGKIALRRTVDVNQAEATRITT